MSLKRALLILVALVLGLQFHFGIYYGADSKWSVHTALNCVSPMSFV